MSPEQQRIAIARDFVGRYCDPINEGDADVLVSALLDAAQKINAASPVGQDALAAASSALSEAIRWHQGDKWRYSDDAAYVKRWDEQSCTLANAKADVDKALASASHASPKATCYCGEEMSDGQFAGPIPEPGGLGVYQIDLDKGGFACTYVAIADGEDNAVKLAGVEDRLEGSPFGPEKITGVSRIGSAEANENQRLVASEEP